MKKSFFCLFLFIFFSANIMNSYADEEKYIVYGREIENGCTGDFDLIRPFGYSQWYGHWGYVNACGKILADYYYASALDFSEGFGLLYEAEGGLSYKGRFVDNTGKILFESEEWNPFGQFHDGLARVKDGLSQGFINHKGEMVISSENFNSARDFSEGIAIVNKYFNPGYGLQSYLAAIDVNGNELFAIPEEYGCQSDFHDGRVLVGTRTYSQPKKPFGYLNTEGDMVIPAVYEAARDFSEGLAAVSKYGWWGLLTLKGMS